MAGYVLGGVIVGAFTRGMGAGISGVLGGGAGASLAGGAIAGGVGGAATGWTAQGILKGVAFGALGGRLGAGLSVANSFSNWGLGLGGAGNGFISGAYGCSTSIRGRRQYFEWCRSGRLKGTISRLTLRAHAFTISKNAPPESTSSFESTNEVVI